MKEFEQGGIKITSLGVLILSYTPRLRLISVLEIEKPPVGAGMLTWRKIKYQHGRGTKCSGINRGLLNSQNCNFPEDNFILISFYYSVDILPQKDLPLCHTTCRFVLIFFHWPVDFSAAPATMIYFSKSLSS
jgi:hypothetical protein